MPHLVRRLLLLLLVPTLALSALPGMVSASSDMTVDQARVYMLSQINTARINNHLIPVRLDPRVQTVSQARSNDMATNHYFGHLLPSERLTKMFDVRHITWYGIGEILAKNDFPTLKASADYTMKGWKASPDHWPIITDKITTFNYAAVGLAYEASTASWIWTVEFLRGPDRTGAKAWFTGSTMTTAASGHTVKVNWAGKDVQLSVMTAGLKDYQLQKRTDGGAWVSVLAHSTVTTIKITVASHHTVQVRLRARDKNGTYGSWVSSGTYTG